MAEREIFDAEAEERRWWDEWFKADYSWEGLDARLQNGAPAKPWKGWLVIEDADREYCAPDYPDSVIIQGRTRLASLQDYWRADPTDGWRLRSDEELYAIGEITKSTFAGKQWHLAHLPDRSLSGEAVSWKANFEDARWDFIQNLLKERVNQCESIYSIHDELGIAVDNKAQFNGIVTNKEIPTKCNIKSEIHVNLSNSVHLTNAFYLRYMFGVGSKFNNALFSSNAYFGEAVFADQVEFNNAKFSGVASFSRSKFLGVAHFISVHFLEETYFDETAFSGFSNFYGSIFRKITRFKKVEFVDGASFVHAQFYGKGIFLNSAMFKGMDFSNSIFSDMAVFVNIKFTEILSFAGVEFKYKSKFHVISFSDGELIGAVHSTQPDLLVSLIFVNAHTNSSPCSTVPGLRAGSPTPSRARRTP